MSARPAVILIEGLHLTASDRRSILECIEFLRGEDNHAMWLGRKGSPKRYCLAPVEDQPNRYRVLIETSYRADHGAKRKRQGVYLVDVRGVEPLPLADWSIAQGELFDSTEATT